MLVGFVVTLRRLWRGHRGLRKTPPPKWFQSNPFGGCISATHQINAVREAFCTQPFCDCSAVALVNTIARPFHSAYPKVDYRSTVVVATIVVATVVVATVVVATVVVATVVVATVVVATVVVATVIVATVVVATFATFVACCFPQIEPSSVVMRLYAVHNPRVCASHMRCASLILLLVASVTRRCQRLVVVDVMSCSSMSTRNASPNSTVLTWESIAACCVFPRVNSSPQY